MIFAPLAMRPFLSRLIGGQGSEAFHILVVILLTLGVAAMVPIEIQLWLGRRSSRLEFDRLPLAIALVLHGLQSIILVRFILANYADHLIFLNNLLVYTFYYLLAFLSYLLDTLGSKLASPTLNRYWDRLSCGAVYFAILGATLYLISGFNIFIRLSESAFGVSILATLIRVGPFAKRRALASLPVLGTIVVLSIATVIVIRHLGMGDLPMVPEVIFSIGIIVIGLHASHKLFAHVVSLADTAKESPVSTKEPGPPPRFPSLSSRENEILQLVLQGLQTKELSKTLHCSEKTIRNHLSHIYGKFQVGNKAELILAVTNSIAEKH